MSFSVRRARLVRLQRILAQRGIEVGSECITFGPKDLTRGIVWQP